MSKNILILLLPITLLAGLAGAAGSIDFTKIRDELDVMADIMRRSVKSNDQCEGCSLNVKSYYLADQGAVFHLRASGFSRILGVPGEGGFDFDFDFDFGHGVAPAVPSNLPILAHSIAEEALHDVEEELVESKIIIQRDGDQQGIWSWFGDESDNEMADEEQEENIRNLRREQRKLKRNVSKLRAQADLEEDKEEKLQKEREEMMRELEKVKEKLGSLVAERKEKMKALHEKRELKHKAMKEKRAATNELIKGLVMKSLCEYQSTLRNLPQQEHISLVFEGMEEKKRTNVFVFKKSTLANCESGKEKFQSKALKYML